MKRLFLLLFAFVAVSLTILADDVTEQEALLKAQQFMKGKTFKQKNLRRAPQRNATKKNAPYYVFNAEGNDGFVIVSGDDRTIPILGYADKGAIDLDNLPDNLKAWLDGYAEVIGSLSGTETMALAPNPSWTAIEPLLSCHWNQSSPYNRQCPVYDGEYSVTGCVATAMAQVMYYYQWPETTSIAIPSYTSSSSSNGKTYTTTLPELPITTFKWNKMKPAYSSDETGEAADAVAELMRYCGQAVQMGYTPISSGANVNAEHLIKYFGYSASATDISRSNYYTQEWEQIIYNELANNRPVLYSGASSSAGHQFVCDGYDGYGLFHINWGWGGVSDGYFVLSVLNPSDLGIGGGTSEDGYTRGQGAIIGIEPSSTIEPETYIPIIYLYNVDFGVSSYNRTSDTEDFTSVSLSSTIGAMDYTGQLEYAWALSKEGERVDVLGQTVVQLDGNSLAYPSSSVSFGANLTDGEYELMVVYKAVGTNNWKKAYYAGSNLIIATIANNTLTLEKSTNTEGQVVLNNVDLSGDFKEGRPMSATMNLTNQTYSHMQTFYLWENNSNIATISTYIDHGQTQNGVFYFVPSTTGSVAYKITNDISGNNVLWSETVTIEETTPQTLEGNISIAGVRNYAITETTIKATVTLTNTGTNNFDDKVYFIVYPEDERDAVIQQEKNITLAVGESTNVEVEFANLKAGSNYIFSVQYYNKSLLSYAAYTTCRVGFEFIPLKLTTSSEVANGTNDREIYGSTLITNVTLTNSGMNAYNEKVKIQLLQEKSGVWYYTLSQEKPVQLAVGETTSFPVEFTDLEIGSKYRVFVYYYSENIETLGSRDLAYTTLADTNINFASDAVKTLCVANWDRNDDGELSMSEAAHVNDLGTVFKDNNAITSFNELEYFTGLASIPNSAFSGCTSLNAVTISANVKSIGTAAFSGCTNLTSVTVRILSPLSIDSECFTNRANATLYVPVSGQAQYQAADYWKEFGNMVGNDANISFADATTKSLCVARWDTNGDGELSMSEAIAVTDIGKVFSHSYIQSFNELQYFTGLTSIGVEAFYYCYYLTSVKIPSSVESIGKNAFYNCSELTSITIPKSVTSLPNESFHGCTAFQACSNLNTIVVESGNTVYDSRNNCNAIIRTADNTLVSGCQNTVIPDGVTAIQDKAFYGCQNLNAIYIPSSVTSIGYDAFYQCSKLDYITVDSENPQFDSRDNSNAIINSEYNSLIVGANKTVIPNTVESIEEHAFAARTGLTAIAIPERVSYIGPYAFAYCTNLVSINIPSNVDELKYSLFYGCGLTSITIPKSVTDYSSYVFYNCDNLVNVRVENKEPASITSSVFSNRTNATLYVPAGSKTAYLAADYWKEFKQIVELGDLNGDGQTTAQDASLALQHVAGKTTLTGTAPAAADLNNDGEVTAQDASLILQHVAGKINW